MILAVDIGNSNIVIGIIKGDEILFIERFSTNRTKTELELAIDIKNILDICDIKADAFDGSIISSVVPEITNVMKLSVKKIIKKDPVIVGSNSNTGLVIDLDNPTEIGSDRVADAVCAISKYEPPMIIIDMGTATTFSVVDKDKRFIGGMILPGVKISLDALTARASKLGGISLEEPKSIIGKNTVDCMRSGLLYGNAASIDGIIDLIKREIDGDPTIIATGGMSGVIVTRCKNKIIHDENLLLKGLKIIYDKSCK